MEKLKSIFTWSLPKANKDIGEYSKKEGVYYLVGMFGQNIIYAIISAALSLFYTDALFVPISAVGIIFAACRVWDAINDPIMGVILERTSTRWGKCRPYLKYMPIPVSLITLALFVPISSWSLTGRIVYLTIIYFLWSPVYTLCDIPLWSLPSRMIPDESKRTKLISWARIVGSAAAVVTAIYPPIKNFFGKIDMGLFKSVGLPNYEGYFSQEQGYFFTTLLLVVVGAILFKFIFPNTRERVVSSDDKMLSFKENFALIKKNKPFIKITISSILGSAKMLLLTAGMYFCKWVMGNGYEGMWIVVLGAPYLVGAFVALFLTPKIGKLMSKKRLYWLSSYLSAVPLVIMFFVCYGNMERFMTPAILAPCIVCLLFFGFFSNFTMALQPIMIADSVDWFEWKNGVRGDGVFFSGLTFVAKLTSGIAILISNVLLGLVSYTPTIEALNKEIEVATAAGTTYELNFAMSYPEISIMMLVLITIVPAISMILQALPMHRYEISDELLAKVCAENKANRLLKAEAEKAAANGDGATECGEVEIETFGADDSAGESPSAENEPTDNADPGDAEAESGTTTDDENPSGSEG